MFDPLAGGVGAIQTRDEKRIAEIEAQLRAANERAEKADLKVRMAEQSGIAFSEYIGESGPVVSVSVGIDPDIADQISTNVDLQDQLAAERAAHAETKRSLQERETAWNEWKQFIRLTTEITWSRDPSVVLTVGRYSVQLMEEIRLLQERATSAERLAQELANLAGPLTGDLWTKCRCAKFQPCQRCRLKELLARPEVAALRES